MRVLEVLSNNQFNTSIWGDEGFSAILSMKSLPEIIKIIANDTSPPLWNIFEWLAFQVFGTDELVIRGLALIFFAGTIFFTYKIGGYLWGKRVGVLASILTAFNPFFFIYAFEGRMYSILALGVTASMYFFLTRKWTGYVIATLWAMYSHHFAIFAVILQGLWFIYEFLKGDKKVASSMFKSFIAVCIGYLPWLIPLYNQTRKVGSGFWLGTPTLADFIGILGKYLGAGIPHPWWQVAVLLSVFVFIVRRWSKIEKSDFFLLSWFLAPIAFTWIVSQFFQSIFFDRYLLYAIPGAMLLAASRGRRRSAIFIGALILVFLNIDIHYFAHPTKRPFRELSNYVKETRQEGDYLINWNAAAHHLWETKYYEIPAPIYIPEDVELPFFVGTALMEEEDVISELPKDASRIGVVTSGSVDEIALPGYTEVEAKNFRNPWEYASQINFAWYQRD